MLQRLYLADAPGSYWVRKDTELATPKRYPPVRQLAPQDKKRIAVTGGAGFVGSHLVDRLMLMVRDADALPCTTREAKLIPPPPPHRRAARTRTQGHDVIVLDNFFTGTKDNLVHWFGHPNFELIRHDVVDPIKIECDRIYHLACPASPPHYQYNSIKTVKTSFLGTLNMLGLAKRVRARFLLTSTSGTRALACVASRTRRTG